MGIEVSEHIFLAKTRGWFDSDPHAVPSSLLPRIRPPLRPEDPNSSGVVPSLSSGPVQGSLNVICMIVLGCVLDGALDVQLLSLAFEAFLSDRINLEIMGGKSLFQKSSVRVRGR